MANTLTRNPAALLLRSGSGAPTLRRQDATRCCAKRSGPTTRRAGRGAALRVAAFKEAEERAGRPDARGNTATSSPPAPAQQKTATVLVIGGGGLTGRGAVAGLLRSAAAPPLRLHALARNARPPSPPTGSPPRRSPSVPKDAAGLHNADLDNVAMLEWALGGASCVWVHALHDEAKPDVDLALLLARAQRLARATAAAGVQRLVYTSACIPKAGRGVQLQVEDALAASGVPLTVLRPGVLMEELYRGSTRAALLQGGSSVLRSLPAASGGRKLQMLAARDLGHVLGHVLSAPDEFKDSALDLAGDELTPGELEAAVLRHKPASLPTAAPTLLSFGLMAADLQRLQTLLSGGAPAHPADVPALRQRFPGLLTLDQFLAATRWSAPGGRLDGAVHYHDDA